MKILNLAAIAAIGLMLMTSFSGCVGGDNTTSGTDTTMGTDETGTNETIGNETGNETLENTANQTATEKIYTAELDGSVLVSATGAENILLGSLGVDKNSGGFDLTKATKLEIIANYTSISGDVRITIWSPGQGSSWNSECDGGGTETIVLKKGELKDAEGSWTFFIYTGTVGAFPSAPGVQISFHMTIRAWDGPVENAYIGSAA